MMTLLLMPLKLSPVGTFLHKNAYETFVCNDLFMSANEYIIVGFKIQDKFS